MITTQDLHNAIISGDIDEVRRCLATENIIQNNAHNPDGSRNYEGDTLAFAIENEVSVEIIKLLLEKGAKVVNDAINPDGSRNYKGDTLAFALINKLSVETIELLLEKGAKVVNGAVRPDGSRDYYADSLYWALHNGYPPETIELLLDNGAEVVSGAVRPDGSRNYDNDSLHQALHIAYPAQTIDLLLRNGAAAEVLNDVAYPNRLHFMYCLQNLVTRRLNAITQTASDFSVDFFDQGKHLPEDVIVQILSSENEEDTNLRISQKDKETAARKGVRNFVEGEG